MNIYLHPTHIHTPPNQYLTQSTSQQANMPFTLQRATIADVPEITDVFFNAFSDDFSRAMFPATEEMRKWWIETYTKDVLKAEAEGSKEVFLIVVESDSDSNVNNDDVNVNQEKKKRRIAAFGQWKLPLTTDEEKEKKRKQDSSAPIWPECSNRDLCSWYFGNSDIRHERLMGGRPHYCEFSPAPFWRFFLSLMDYFMDHLTNNKYQT